jgi:large subunit ribosomal protein L15
LVRRLPFKRGFTNLFRIVYQEVNVEQLAEVFKAGEAVTAESLVARKLIKDADKPVVILGEGELSVTLNVSAHRFTKSARAKIEAAGGTVNQLALTVTGARATVKLLPKAQRGK